VSSAFEEPFQRLVLRSHIAAHPAGERPVKDTRQPLPCKDADLREARAITARLNPILHVEDRRVVLLAKGETLRWPELHVFECELHRSTDSTFGHQPGSLRGSARKAQTTSAARAISIDSSTRLPAARRVTREEDCMGMPASERPPSAYAGCAAACAGSTSTMSASASCRRDSASVGSASAEIPALIRYDGA
jgi:hypothetical protein